MLDNKLKPLRRIVKDIFFNLSKLSLSANQFDSKGDGIKTLPNETRKEFYDRITLELYMDFTADKENYLAYYKAYCMPSDDDDGVWNSEKWSDFVDKHLSSSEKGYLSDILMPNVLCKYLPKYYCMFRDDDKCDAVANEAKAIYEYFKLN